MKKHSPAIILGLIILLAISIYIAVIGRTQLKSERNLNAVYKNSVTHGWKLREDKIIKDSIRNYIKIDSLNKALSASTIKAKDDLKKLKKDLTRVINFTVSDYSKYNDSIKKCCTVQ